jgi:hypothetical protein
MQIQPIGSQQLLLYIDKQEMRSRGITAGGLGLREILGLTREACHEAGISPPRLEEIELYPDRHGALVFIRLAPLEKEWFRLDSLPQGLDALQSFLTPPEGELVWYGGHYYLSGKTDSHRAILSEFGQPLKELEAAALEEEGSLILDATGITTLWRKIKK